MTTRATKRIPVKQETWEALSYLKEPGQTFDELIDEMICREQDRRMIVDIKDADAPCSGVNVK